MSAQPPEQLHAALQRRGYSFRQHLEEVGWTRRKLTVVDLDDRQRAALERDGVEGLRRVLDEQGLWSFPSLEIEKPLPVQPDVVLAEAGAARAVVVAPAAGVLRQMAGAFIGMVEARSGGIAHRSAGSPAGSVRLTLLDGDEAELSLLRSQHVVLFGGSHECRFAMDMALRYQAGFVDGTIPGEDGWVVTTHVGLDASGHNVAQVTASAARREEALACLREALVVDAERVLLRCTHRIHQGPEMRAHFPSWEAWTAGLSGTRGSRPVGSKQSVGGSRDSPAHPAEPSGDAPESPATVADRLAPGLDSGGPEVNRYNAAPIDIAVQSAQYYQRSGDPRALQLFRELLFRLADYYLKTPAGASYPADLDFRIGSVILYYSRLEHEAVFSEEDRLILANLLLSCARSIHEYAARHWPIRPGAPTRHNHETFPARSLMVAADYFERYGVAYVADWRVYVEDVFGGEIWNRFKQQENANGYETYAFEHGAAYSTFTGHRLDLFDRECLRLAARRHIITADNFCRPVDYGDSSPSMRPGHADKLAVIFTSQYEDPTLQWFAQACFDREPGYLPAALDSFTGIRRPYRGPAPDADQWELLPLDPRFAESHAPGFPHEYTFDKLAFRSGWDEEAHYLLFEGVGNLKVSHSHNDVNGIVRLNHLGRHLVVSNGYGRRVGIGNVADSFSTRVRGPEDHNTLVLRRGGEIVRDLPVCSALLQRGQSGELAYATGALLGYGEVDWFRTLVILAGRFVLTLDRIRIIAPGLEGGHIEWNCPGELTELADGFRIAQQGVFLDVTSASGWDTTHGVSDQSADWKSLLESGAYPYATWPLKKLLFHLPAVEAGRTHSLAVLLAATRSPEPNYRVSEPEPGLVRIEARDGGPPVLSVAEGDLSVRGGGASLEVRFAPVPDLPLALKGAGR